MAEKKVTTEEKVKKPAAPKAATAKPAKEGAAKPAAAPKAKEGAAPKAKPEVKAAAAEVKPEVKEAAPKAKPAPKAESKKALKVTLIKSVNGCLKNQKATVEALGLRKIRQEKIHPDNPAMRGMVFKVRHLVKVEEITL